MILAAIILASSPIALPADINVKTTVDGITYRVRVKGNTARIYRKTSSVDPTPETREAMRVAARQATGCEMIDPYFIDAHLVALLDCSSRSQRSRR